MGCHQQQAKAIVHRREPAGPGSSGQPPETSGDWVAAPVRNDVGSRRTSQQQDARPPLQKGSGTGWSMGHPISGHPVAARMFHATVGCAECVGCQDACIHGTQARRAAVHSAWRRQPTDMAEPQWKQQNETRPKTKVLDSSTLLSATAWLDRVAGGLLMVKLSLAQAHTDPFFQMLEVLGSSSWLFNLAGRRHAVSLATRLRSPHREITEVPAPARVTPLAGRGWWIESETTGGERCSHGQKLKAGSGQTTGKEPAPLSKQQRKAELMIHTQKLHHIRSSPQDQKPTALHFADLPPIGAQDS